VSLLDAILDAADPVEGLLSPGAFLDAYRREAPEVIAFDTESPTWKWQLPRSVPFALQFSWSREHSYYVPCARGGALDQEAAELLYEVFLTAPTIVMQNGKYDLHVAKRLLDAFDLPLVVRRIEDTMILDAVLDEARHHGLKERCLDLGIRFSDEDPDQLRARIAAWREEASQASGREVGYDEVPARLMVPYARQDAYLTRELYRHQTMELEEQLQGSDRERDLAQIYELELRLQWVIFGMEERGMRVDLDFVWEQILALTPQLEHIRVTLREALGWEMNPGSTDDLARALRDLGREDALWVNPDTGKVNLPEWRLKELEKDESAGDTVRMVLEYRTAQKMLSSYYETIRDEHRLDEQGQAIVRCSVKQMGARTGRMSITEPALQTIPREKGEVRGAFIAREGHTLIFADYEQQELRVLAHYMSALNHHEMTDIFRMGELDLHRETAAAMYTAAYDEVTPTMRADGKETNFAIVYGAGIKRIASLHGVDEATAKQRLYRVYDRFPGLTALKRTCERLMREREYVITSFGRRHRERNGRYAYKAINSLVQGTSADMTKAAMVRIDDAFHAEDMESMIVLSIHDEIITESPDEELDRAVEIVRGAMLDVPEIDVPMSVEIKTARRWSEK
jgi:DNA polymerase-1